MRQRKQIGPCFGLNRLDWNVFVALFHVRPDHYIRRPQPLTWVSCSFISYSS
jgi:hypothetical protein